MKITFLGTGGAFASIEQGQSNMLIESDTGKKLLIDCGTTAPFKLKKLGISANDIDAVYISHLHSDHVGGLEWLGFMTYFTSDHKPTLFGEKETLTSLWENTLKGGMSRIDDTNMTLKDYFNCQPVDIIPDDIDSDESFIWEECIFDLIPLIHVKVDSNDMISYGLMISDGVDSERITFISTDAKSGETFDYLECADVIFHECEVGVNSKVHTQYTDMKDQIALDTKAKMWLYHYSKKVESVAEDGFRGFVNTFDTFDLFTGEKKL